MLVPVIRREGTIMKSVSSTNILSQDRQRVLTSLAVKHGVRELWLFGSAVAPRSKIPPNDIDVAFICVPGSTKDTLTESLRKRFPGCHADHAQIYIARRGSDTRSPPLHFVLAHDSPGFWAHPIAGSIRSGIRLWRAS